MNLLNNCTTKEIKLLEELGIIIEDKDYNEEELRKYENEIKTFIMNHSTKNGDIDRATNLYSSILNKITKENIQRQKGL